MNIYRIILIIFLVSIGITSLGVSTYISFLKEQNNLLLTNLDQIAKRAATLESDKTLEWLSTLRAENAALKGQIESLKVELSRVARTQKVSQPVRLKAKRDIEIVGNQGYLIRDGKPTY